MKILKSKLYQQVLEKKKDFDNFSGDKKDISWEVKSDLTFFILTAIKIIEQITQTSNVNVFMDGDIDLFIKEYLIKNMELIIVKNNSSLLK